MTTLFKEELKKVANELRSESKQAQRKFQPSFAKTLSFPSETSCWVHKAGSIAIVIYDTLGSKKGRPQEYYYVRRCYTIWNSLVVPGTLS